MKQLLHRAAALALALALAAGLAGCGQSGQPSEGLPPVASVSAPSAPDIEMESETQTFTDSLGREVKLPAKLGRVAPSGSLAQIVLYSLAPERLVGWSSRPTEEMAAYFDAAYTNLPTFGTFYGKNADLNLEALLAAGPQVVIDMGQLKEDMAQDLDALQEQLGVPVVFIEAELETMGPAYRKLGGLLGLSLEAEALAAYCDQTVSEAKEKAASIPEEDRTGVYYGEAADGLQANARGSFHAEVLELVGAVNVADIPVTSGKNAGIINFEQLLLWQPDVILFGPESMYGAAKDDALWRQLSAVQAGRVYEVPSGPYNWLGRPPAVNRVLGVKWLGNLLYPEQFDYDLVAEAKAFYKLFYHYDLTEEQAKELMAHSTFASGQAG